MADETIAKGIVGKVGSAMPAITFNAAMYNVFGNKPVILRETLGLFFFYQGSIGRGVGIGDGVIFYIKEDLPITVGNAPYYVVGVRIDMSKDDPELYTIENYNLDNLIYIEHDDFLNIEDRFDNSEEPTSDLSAKKDMPLYLLKNDNGILTVEKDLRRYAPKFNEEWELIISFASGMTNGERFNVLPSKHLENYEELIISNHTDGLYNPIHIFTTESPIFGNEFYVFTGSRALWDNSITRKTEWKVAIKKEEYASTGNSYLISCSMSYTHNFNGNHSAATTMGVRSIWGRKKRE